MTTAAPDPNALRPPRSEAEAVAVAHSLGLAIPPACMPGVLANLALLDRHTAIFMERAPGATA